MSRPNRLRRSWFGAMSRTAIGYCITITDAMQQKEGSRLRRDQGMKSKSDPKRRRAGNYAGEAFRKREITSTIPR
jgi:hypothetical protein